MWGTLSALNCRSLVMLKSIFCANGSDRIACFLEFCALVKPFEKGWLVYPDFNSAWGRWN